jgi:hypothetical protein
VTYTAEFAFKGAARYFAPLFRPALTRLGNQAEAGLHGRLADWHDGILRRRGASVTSAVKLARQVMTTR